MRRVGSRARGPSMRSAELAPATSAGAVSPDKLMRPTDAAHPGGHRLDPRDPPQGPAQGDVFGYIRVSSWEQGAHGTSLDEQREAILRYCAERHLPEPRIFVEVQSAGDEKIERRVELARVIALLKAGDTILVTRADRWSRDLPYGVASVRALVRRLVRWVAVVDSIDASTEEGDRALSFMALLADQEHRRIRARTVGARQRLRGQGLYVEGPPPMGYRVEARRLVPGDQAQIMRDMFALVTVKSTREVSEILIERYPGVGGLDPAAIARKVADRRYLGQLRPKATKNVRAKPGDAWLENTHEPLIDRATWEAARAAVAARRQCRRAGTDSSTADFLLRGVARCGSCGGPIRGHVPKKGGAGWYVCSRACSSLWVPRDRIERVVEDDLLEQLGALTEQLSAPPEHAPAKPPDFVKRKAAIATKRERLVRAIVGGIVTDEDARATRIELDAALARVEREQAEHEASVADASPEARAATLASVQEIALAWSGLEAADKRQILATHAERLELFRTDAPKWSRLGRWRLEVLWKMGDAPHLISETRRISEVRPKAKKPPKSPGKKR